MQRPWGHGRKPSAIQSQPSDAWNNSSVMIFPVTETSLGHWLGSFFQSPVYLPLPLTNDIGSASYRDLLGTADTIVGMDGQMQRTEYFLGDLGRRCNTRLIEKGIVNLHDWNGDSGIAGAEPWQMFEHPRFNDEEY